MPIENLDWYFTIAKQHTVCEDYVVTGWEPVPHAIVCDGCSSSEHTDVGARILAWSARKALQFYYSDCEQPVPAYHEIGNAVIHNAYAAVDLLNMKPFCLDATLLLAFYVRGTCYVYVYGDGYVITIGSDGKYGYSKINFELNMPYYLTYWVDTARRDLYLSANKGKREVMALTECIGEQERVSKLNHDAPLVFTFPDHEFRLVALASDGVSSLVSPDDNEKVLEKDVLERLIAYKTTKGEFVKRRTKRMLKNYDKQNISPTDDFSIATMLLN